MQRLREYRPQAAKAPHAEDNPDIVDPVAQVGCGGPRFFLNVTPPDPANHRAFGLVDTRPGIAAAPPVESVAREMSGLAIVRKLDTEAHPERANRSQSRRIPDFALLEGRSVVRQEAGSDLCEAAELARAGGRMTGTELASPARSRVIRLLALTTLLVVGCAQGYPNRPLESWRPDYGYRGTVLPDNTMHQGKQADDLLLMLSFSGGGSRAAAFSYGVLEVLSKTEIEREGVKTRLLDQVDAISSVSGGSFTAAYYGLFGDRIFEDFEEKFLTRNFHAAILSRFFLPYNWIRFLSPHFGRSDLAAAYYDRHLFEGQTFGDLAQQGRMGVIINAADMPVGSRFGFTQSQFDAICSDLSPFPVSRAVAASSAVPIVMTPIVLRNHAGRCGYVSPAWMSEAIEGRDTTSRRFHFAVAQESYLDAEARPYVHLVDGGIADNLGVTALLDPVFAEGSFWQVMRERGFESVRRVVVIAVDAETAGPETSGFWQATPGLAQVVDAVSDIQIRRYSYETLELLRTSFENWRSERALPADRRRPEVSFHMVHVAFEALRDPEERAYLSGLSSTLNLSEEAVARLRLAAAKILDESVEFQGLLEETTATSDSAGSPIEPAASP